MLTSQFHPSNGTLAARQKPSRNCAERVTSRDAVHLTHAAWQVPAGPHFLTWVFHKEREYSWMTENMQSTGGLEDRAVLEQILVTGVTEGGAVECEACPAGECP